MRGLFCFESSSSSMVWLIKTISKQSFWLNTAISIRTRQSGNVCGSTDGTIRRRENIVVDCFDNLGLSFYRCALNRMKQLLYSDEVVISKAAKGRCYLEPSPTILRYDQFLRRQLLQSVVLYHHGGVVSCSSLLVRTFVLADGCHPHCFRFRTIPIGHPRLLYRRLRTEFMNIFYMFILL